MGAGPAAVQLSWRGAVAAVVCSPDAEPGAAADRGRISSFWDFNLTYAAPAAELGRSRIADFQRSFGIIDSVIRRLLSNALLSLRWHGRHIAWPIDN